MYGTNKDRYGISDRCSCLLYQVFTKIPAIIHGIDKKFVMGRIY